MDRRAAILGAFLGDSKSIAQLRLRASIIAVEAGPVLLWGESGAGKRLLASLIHRAGRMGRPLVSVSGATLTLEQLPRLFDDAGEGTLLIEEIEQSRASVQQGLAGRLRERVAGSSPLHARVITTCCGEPFVLCERGALEPVLYQEAAGTLLGIPALRERPGDRRGLAQHFLLQHRDVGYGDIEFSEEALDLIETLELRGNAAELESLVVRIGVLRRRGAILSDDVLAALSLEGEPGWRRARAEAMREFAQSYLGSLLASSLPDEGPEDLPESLREFVRLWRDGARALRGVDLDEAALGAWLDGQAEAGRELEDATLVAVDAQVMRWGGLGEGASEGRQRNIRVSDLDSVD